MATLTIGQATPNDVPELARLLDLFANQATTPTHVTARMLACRSVLTAFLGALTDIYAEVPFRRYGVARAVLVQAEAAARIAGASALVLITGLDNAARRRRSARVATPRGPWRCGSR